MRRDKEHDGEGDSKLKHFKLVGPNTTTEFDINDDEMMSWAIMKMVDFDENPSRFKTETLSIHNEKTYTTKDNDLK